MENCNKGVEIIRVTDTCEGTKTVTGCIIHEDAITYLDLAKDSDLTLVINRLLVSLSDARDRINNLEYKINKTPNQEVQINLEDMPSGFAWRVGQDPGYTDESKHFHLVYLTIGKLRELVEKNEGILEPASVEIETSTKEGHNHKLTLMLEGANIKVTKITSNSTDQHKAFPITNYDYGYQIDTGLTVDVLVPSYDESQRTVIGYYPDFNNSESTYAFTPFKIYKVMNLSTGEQMWYDTLNNGSEIDATILPGYDSNTMNIDNILVILHKASLNGGEVGTEYGKFVPQGIFGERRLDINTAYDPNSSPAIIN